MGLSIEVGMLADAIQNDEDAAAYIREEFDTLNRYLTSIGLQPHLEPTGIESWSGDMFGYSGLHYLRRLAAHLNYTRQLPPPGDRNAADDPLLRRYYTEFGQFDGSTPYGAFDHLIIHSDAEGFYLPQDFQRVLVPGEDFPVTGDSVGSSYRLRDECQQIASALQLPLELDAEDEQVLNAADSQGIGEITWERYGMESYSCLRLYHAAQYSIKTGAAIVFC